MLITVIFLKLINAFNLLYNLLFNPYLLGTF